jgi:hypothetical protein
VVHRALPDRPSLEYLKKEAKELLRSLQQRRVARLADAQHALARQYGFASWTQLKRHVEGAAPAASPFAGHWKANPDKSKPPAASPFRIATLQFGVRGHVMTIAQSLVGESGEERHDRTALHVDGDEHVSDDRPGFILVARWRSAHVVQVTAKKDGEVVGLGTYEVSADGRELSLTDSVSDTRFVFDRE